MNDGKLIPQKRDGGNQEIVGKAYPVVRIKDYQVQPQDIVYFEVETKEFLPTLHLVLHLPFPSLMRENAPIDGDMVTIYFRQDIEVFRPVGGDYIITHVDNSEEGDGIDWSEVTIDAELWIPNLISDNMTFNFCGTADDALRDAAKRGGLGFVRSDDIKTELIQPWLCVNNLEEYIKHVTVHMWKAEDSFFDSWIDVHKNLNVVNVNDLLGRKLSDDGRLDITKFMNTIGTQGEDGKYVSTDYGKHHMPKLFSNLDYFKGSQYYVFWKQFFNRSSAVTQQVGIQHDINTYANNNGLDEMNSAYQVHGGVWYNQEKLDDGYQTANGRAKETLIYKQADNGSYREQMNSKTRYSVTPIESDGDGETTLSNGHNGLASGNVHKMFDVAEIHNRINNDELKKQYVVIRTRGANLSIAKGEKVPMILIENSLGKWVTSNLQAQDLSFMLDRKMCGWFYISAIKWVFAPGFGSQAERDIETNWYTEVTLTRREWMAPFPTSNAEEAGDDTPGQYGNNTASGSSVDSTPASESTPTSSDTSSSTEVKPENENAPVDHQDNDTDFGSSGYVYTVRFDEDEDDDTSDTSSSGSGDGGSGGGLSGSSADIESTSSGDTSSRTESLITDDGTKEMKELELDTSEAVMAFDGNGLKHYMNVLIDIMSQQGIPFKIIAGRRWAVDPDDNIVEGNAFTKRAGKYKVLTDTGDLLWFSSHNSRHLYGEAFDIVPTSGSFSDLLTKICLDHKVIKCMNVYGICLSVETTEGGSAAGSHFHISTDTNYQTLFWEVANEKRERAHFKLLNPVTKSIYYQDEILNKVQNV